MAITRFKNSSILNRGPKYNDFLAGLPFRPVIGTATDGGTGTTVSVAFTGNNVANGTITYTALSSPGSITATGPASPITVTGLTAGTAYTFQVKAGNSLGDSAYSGSSNSVTPVQPTAYESIASTTLGSDTASVTFSSISGTYQHLQIRLIARSTSTGTGGEDYFIRLNSDTGSNYAYHDLNGNGSAVATNAGSSSTYIGIFNAVPRAGETADSFAANIIDIHDYANTSKNKTVRYFHGYDVNGSGRVILGSGLWMNTAAVTTIVVQASSGNFKSGTVVSLYGIKG